MHFLVRNACATCMHAVKEVTDNVLQTAITSMSAG